MNTCQEYLEKLDFTSGYYDAYLDSCRIPQPLISRSSVLIIKMDERPRWKMATWSVLEL